MRDSHGMAVSDGIDNWTDGIWCKFLTKLFLFNNSVKQLSTLHYLHDHIEFIFGIVYFKQLHYVWVIYLTQDLDLISDHQLIIAF